MLSRPAHAWAAEAAASEIRMVDYAGSYVRYRIHQIDAKGDQIRDVFESKEGTVARLIARDGRPLTAAEDAAERDRLNDMIGSPDTFERHVHGDLAGKKTAVELIGYMPDAMTYQYAPGQPQRVGRTAAEGEPSDVVLDYEPRPGWKPPTMAATALTGLSGRLWIDPRTHTLTRMEGHFVRPVTLGWGMVARVAPGGELVLEQKRVSNDRSIFSRFVQHMTIRALMVKTVKVDSDIRAYHFETVPETGYRDAIRTLLATPLPDASAL